MIPLVLSLAEDEPCSSCGTLIKADTQVVAWNDETYCSLVCFQHERDAYAAEEGIDFSAAQDQALAALDEVRGMNPEQFVFVWQGESSGVGTVIFAHPGFVMQAIAALTEGLVTAVPSVAPPD